jgi:hypothetical protein
MKDKPKTIGDVLSHHGIADRGGVIARQIRAVIFDANNAGSNWNATIGAGESLQTFLNLAKSDPQSGRRLFSPRHWKTSF